MLLLNQISIIVILLSFHKTFFNDDSQNIDNNIYGYKHVRKHEELSCQGAYHFHIIISVPNHVAMHHSNQGVATLLKS